MKKKLQYASISLQNSTFSSLTAGGTEYAYFSSMWLLYVCIWSLGSAIACYPPM